MSSDTKTGQPANPDPERKGAIPPQGEGVTPPQSEAVTPRKGEGVPQREGEEHFRLLVEQVKDYAIFMLDPGGKVMTWNAGAERIKGYRAEEIIGQHFSRFYPAKEVAEGWPNRELEMALQEGRFEDEGWRIRKDGSTFWANVVITPIYKRTGRLTGFAKVTRDMSDRRRIQELESAERGTNEFLAMLGHELRNPLAPMRNAIDVLRSDADETTKEWSRSVIERQIAQLTRLVDDLLDMSRVTRGTISLRKEPVELATVVARAIESCHPLVEARRHQLVVDLPEEPLWVKGDLMRLSQVVMNLLNNSAKYTPMGGRIDLSVRQENGDVLISVRDTGIGMPQDLLPTVFDLFKQGARSLDRSEGGLGLGLSIVRRIIEMHGGSVEAHSEGPGQGSEFVIRLRRLDRPKLRTDQRSSRESSHALPRSSRRVLVVDDNADSAETAVILLQLWGHEVRSVHDGPDAVSLAAEFLPEVVLLDIGLPGMNGYEVARRIREIPGLEKILIMAMTGYGQEGDRRRALEGGFDRFLVKPLEPGSLKRLIDSAPTEPAT